jgi:hypothetical protein
VFFDERVEFEQYACMFFDHERAELLSDERGKQ